MYVYRIPTTSDESILHADHIWEEWHAYVNDITDAPEGVNGDSTGICCHTCQTIVVDPTPATDALI